MSLGTREAEKLLCLLCLFVANLCFFAAWRAILPRNHDCAKRTRSKRPRYLRILRTSERSRPAFFHRTLGALQLLRHALHSHPLYDVRSRSGRPRFRRQTSLVNLRLVHDGRLSDGFAGRLDRRSFYRCSSGRVDWRNHHCGRAFFNGVPFHDARLYRNGIDCDRYRTAKTEHQRHGRQPLSPERPAPRQRILDLLHGHKCWRAARSPCSRLPREGRNVQGIFDLDGNGSGEKLALGIWSGRRRNDRGACCLSSKSPATREGRRQESERRKGQSKRRSFAASHEGRLATHHSDPDPLYFYDPFLGRV